MKARKRSRWLAGWEPLTKITSQGRNGRQVWATFKAGSPLERAELNYTCQSDKWQDRKWNTAPATIDDDAHKVATRLPQGVTVYYLNLVDR